MTPQEVLKRLSLELGSISEERKVVLDALANFTAEKIKEDGEVKLNFICTHNSRRSHLAQVWMQAAADYVGLEKVETCSAGTETTAVHANTIASFKYHGFDVSTEEDGDNPRYTLVYNNEKPGLTLFSKELEDDFNPQSNFGAAMTCSNASEACPFVPGALKRFSLDFEDPKEFDADENPVEGYVKRSEEIALDILYVATKAKAMV